jgi:CubicO group peptidase (beta-lactamase class C family)
MPAKAAMITLQQLLTMTSGLPETLTNNDQVKPPKDWVAAILALPVYTRRREFAYSDYGAHLISAVLAEAINVSVLEYARSRLFDPLGIVTRPAAEPIALLPANKDAYDKADFAWPIDPQGIHTGQALLKLTPPDMMKFGQLYLNGGRWQGRQVVPEAWVRESTRSHVATELTEAEGTATSGGPRRQRATRHSAQSVTAAS